MYCFTYCREGRGKEQGKEKREDVTRCLKYSDECKDVELELHLTGQPWLFGMEVESNRSGQPSFVPDCSSRSRCVPIALCHDYSGDAFRKATTCKINLASFEASAFVIARSMFLA